MNFCKCGCGLLVSKNYKRGCGRKGKKNSFEHNQAIRKANKGRIWSLEERERRKTNPKCHGWHHTEETKKKWSEIAKSKNFGKWMLGKKHSEETKQKISQINLLTKRRVFREKGFIVSDETKKKISIANSKEKNGMYGKKHPSEIIELIREQSIKNWQNPEYRHNHLNHPEKINNCRKGALASVSKNPKKRYTNTKPERKMAKILDQMELIYEHPYSVFDIEHCYSADFFIPSKKLIIEVDGIFWHKYPDGLPIDQIRNKELQQKGYQILRFWGETLTKQEVRQRMMELN